MTPYTLSAATVVILMAPGLCAYGPGACSMYLPGHNCERMASFIGFLAGSFRLTRRLLIDPPPYLSILQGKTVGSIFQRHHTNGEQFASAALLARARTRTQTVSLSTVIVEFLPQ